MKKLFSLILVALISSQMWGGYIKVTLNGTGYSSVSKVTCYRSTSDNSATNITSSVGTVNSPSSNYVTVYSGDAYAKKVYCMTIELKNSNYYVDSWTCSLTKKNSVSDVASAGATAAYYVDGNKIYFRVGNNNASFTCSATIKSTVTTYKVKFNANGGSGSMSDQNFTYGTAQNLTANAFTAPTGKHFTGWATSSTGSVSYTDGQSVNNLTATDNGTFNLYAVWAYNTYKVRFNANGGSGSMSDQNFTYGTAQNLTTNAFTAPTGKVFAGWATTEAGSVSYTNGQSVNNLTTTNNGTFNLYAVWVQQYSVTFRTSEDDANPAVKSDYHYGDEITNCPAIDPQKIGDETHTYTFLGWYLDNTDTRYEAGMTVSGNMIFTARFDEQIIEVVPVTYNVTIGSFAANGKVIITSQDNVREITATGATLTFDAGKSLTIQAVPNAYYHFAGWTEDNDEEAVIDIRTLNEDHTYTPTFAANVALTLEDTHNEAYYSDLYNQHDGDVLTVTLANRQLTEGNWITFCAPFDFTIPAGHPFYGTAYLLQNATMSGSNTSAYISLDFRRTYEIRANMPYLIVPTMTTMSNLEFDGVTIEEAPTVRTTAAQSGQVEFVSVPWQTKITNDATKPNIYLASGNTLRYVSTAGTTFRAFRAYFHRVVNLGAPRRMVISLDGVETTKQLTEDGEVTDTTEKRLENGVLIIERNGVRYDAQGKRL